MSPLALRSTLVLVFSLCIAPFVAAEEIQIAKVYRDYPGYIEPPTCVNPRLSDQSQPGTAGNAEQAWRSASTDRTAAWRGVCPQAWSLTPMVGYQVFDGALDLDDDVSFGLALGYHLTSNWALELDLRYVPSEIAVQSLESVDVNVWTVSGNLLYHLRPEQRLVPYLAAGAGVMIYDADGADGNDEDFMASWGGGVKYAINNTAALRLDLRHILDYRSSADFDTSDSTWRHQLSAMAGLTFQFGR